MKILIIKTSALGDIVHSFPALAFLKYRFPEAQIDWVVECPFSSLVKSHPFVSRTIEVDTKNWRKGLFSSSVRKEISQFVSELRQETYDIIFDLQANMKSGLITLLAKGKDKVGFSLESVSEWPNVLCTKKRFKVPQGLSVRDDYLRLVQRYFEDDSPFTIPSILLELSEVEQAQLFSVLTPLYATQKSLVLVCHGSNWKNKQLPLETLVDFLKRLQSHLNCHFLFAWGSENEKKESTFLCQQFVEASLLEKVSLSVLQHIMTKMQLVIAMDSLPLHLAATTSVRTFSVFGASLASRYAPSGEQNFSVQGSCPYARTFKTRCPILRNCKTGACIRSMAGEKLFEAYLTFN